MAQRAGQPAGEKAKRAVGVTEKQREVAEARGVIGL